MMPKGFFSMTFLSVFLLICFGCKQSNLNGSKPTVPIIDAPLPEVVVEQKSEKITPGAYRIENYIGELVGKRVAMVVNQTSAIGQRHLVDSLLALRININKIFSPEHGFRGEADAGAHVKNGKDAKTGLPLLSLYGKNKKPTAEQLSDVDVVVFDIQDVGVRFYTYISTLAYVMEACAEQGKRLIVLDRPNPNGHYVDGPILEKKHASFVGMHPVPVVYGMTIGEYAKMVNGENWLSGGITCDLTVVTCENYDHNSFYELPIPPSPNLRDMKSIYLYPSICFFEGTVASEGRGTQKPFQMYGHPLSSVGDVTFTPVSGLGSKSPKLEGQLCKGYDLSNLDLETLRGMRKVDLKFFIDFYQGFQKKETFFLPNNFFNLLAGNSTLMADIKAGKSPEEIYKSWEKDLEDFKKVRDRYLLY